MYLLKLNNDKNFAVMGFDLNDAYAKQNSAIEEVYLEQILQNPLVYLMPIDPFTTETMIEGATQSVKEATTGTLNLAKKAMNANPLLASTLIGLAFIAILFGSSGIDGIINNIAGKFDDYYDFLAFTRIRTVNKSNILLQNALKSILYQPNAAANLLGQLTGQVSSLDVLRVHKVGIEIIKERLKQASQKNTIPVLIASTKDINFSEEFHNEVKDDPMINLVENIFNYLVPIFSMAYLGSSLIGFFIKDAGNALKKLGINSDKDFLKYLPFNKAIGSGLQDIGNTLITFGGDVNSFGQNAILPLLYYTAMQAKPSLPRIYTNSTRSAKIGLTLKFRANNIYDVFDNILVPLMYIEALALPRKYEMSRIITPDIPFLGKDINNDIDNISKTIVNFINLLPFYGPPFYVSCVIPGKAFIPFGIITDFRVSYDTDVGSMIGGHPIACKVDLEIEDLTPVVMYRYSPTGTIPQPSSLITGGGRSPLEIKF